MEYVKIVIGTHTGYCGMDSWEFYKVNASSTSDARYSFAWERALENAAMYGIYPECEMPDDYDEDEDGGYGDQYSSNIEGWWEPYNPDKHDGHRIGGDNTWERIYL